MRSHCLHRKQKVLLAIMVMATCLSPCVSLSDDQDAQALYTHCLQQWTAQAAGETCFAWAKTHGIPEFDPIGTRSTEAAYIYCRQHFDDILEEERDGIARARACWLFATEGPPSWRP